MKKPIAVFRAKEDDWVGAGDSGQIDPQVPRICWKPLRSERTTSCIDWHAWLDCDRHIDPYLVWADITDFQGLGGHPDPMKEKLPLLVELSRDHILLEDPSGRLSHECQPPLSLLTLANAYKTRETDTSTNNTLVYTAARFVTASAPLAALTILLSSADCIRRFQLGAARISEPKFRDFQDRIEPLDLGDLVPTTVVAVIDDGCAFAHPAFQSFDREVNDTRSRVQYLWDQDPVPATGGWRQNIADGLFNYGRELRASKESMPPPDEPETVYYAKMQYAPLPLQPYAQGTFASGSETYGAMRPNPHGTAVLGIAAGNPARDEERVLTNHLYQSPVARDTADQWKLLFVQLPTRTTLDTSGGSLGVHVLDAVRYVVARAESIKYSASKKVVLERPNATDIDGSTVSTRAKAEVYFDLFGISVAPNSVANSPWRTRNLGANVSNQIVVNISYGAIAGPHDGTSMIEEALTELVNLREGLHIVTAAGNAHRQQAHAALDLSEGQPGTFTWSVGPDNPLESYLEVWLPSFTEPNGQDQVAHSLPDQNTCGFHLTVWTPDGVSVAIKMGQAKVLMDDSATGALPRAGIIFARKVSQGLNGTMVLIAVASTRAEPNRKPSDRPLGLHGDWLIQVAHVGGGEDPQHMKIYRVHAWAERNDLVYGNARRQQSTVHAGEQPPEATEFTPNSFLQRQQSRRNDSAHSPEPYQLAYSLGSLAGGNVGPDGRKVVVASAYRRVDKEMAPYSSGGPSRMPAVTSLGPSGRREGPDVDAGSDESVSTRGTRSTGMRPGLVSRLSGTSAAAPQVTRWLANLTYLSSHKLNAELARFIYQTLDDSDPTVPAESRPTPTPAGDDLYRKGKIRLK